MGWFDAILDTAASGIGFLVNNAGDIAGAAGTIAKIVGSVLVEGEEDDTLATAAEDGTSIIPKMQKNLIRNEKVMRQAAQILSAQHSQTQEQQGKDDDEANSTVVTQMDYTGILPNLAVVANGQALPSIDADINKLLALNDFPTTLLTSTQVPIDVGAAVGAQMCSNLTKVDPHILPKPVNLLHAPPISVGPDEDGTMVTGEAVFYPIPTCGNNQGIDAYHAHVALTASMPLAAAQKWAKRKKDLAIANTGPRIPKKDPNGDKIVSPYNATTVSANWTTSIQAADIMSKAVKSMDQKFKPEPWSQAGQ